MTLQLLHSEFPYMYEENLFFYQCSIQPNSRVQIQNDDDFPPLRMKTLEIGQVRAPPWSEHFM